MLCWGSGSDPLGICEGVELLSRAVSLIPNTGLGGYIDGMVEDHKAK